MIFSIIIPCYNGEQYIENCLNSVIKKTNLKDYEIIVVDDYSKNEISKSMSGKFFAVKFLRNNKNLGFVRTCNRGAEEAKGKFLVFLNVDTVIKTENWLSIIKTTFDNDKKIGAVGVKLIYPGINLIQTAGDEINPVTKSPTHLYKFAPPTLPSVNKYRELDIVTGAALTIKGNLFHKLNGFSEEFISTFEDGDLCLRVKKLNYKIVYQPLVSILHYESVTGVTESMSFKSYFVFYKKWEEYILQKKKSIYEEDGYNDLFIRRLQKLYFKNFSNIIFTIKKLGLEAKDEQGNILKLRDIEIIDLVIEKIKKGEEPYLSDFLFYKMFVLIKKGNKLEAVKCGKESLELNDNSVYSDRIKILFRLLNTGKTYKKHDFGNPMNYNLYLFMLVIENGELLQNNDYKQKQNLIRTIQILNAIIEVISKKRLKKYIDCFLSYHNTIVNKSILINFLFLVLRRLKLYKNEEILKLIESLINKYDWPKFKSIKYLINLGSYYENNGYLSRAEKYFLKAIDTDPYLKHDKLLSSAFFHLGVCNIKNNKPLAKKYFTECLRYEPNHRKAKEYLSEINEIGDDEKK